MEKILSFINRLPLRLREICYFIYLLIQLLGMIKTFFNPNKSKIAPQFDGTNIPVETSDGIVTKFMTDDEIRTRYAYDNAMELDPAYLASKGVEPVKFGGSVISPLDAHESIVDSALSALSSIQSKPSEPASSSSSEPIVESIVEPSKTAN